MKMMVDYLPLIQQDLLQFGRASVDFAPYEGMQVDIYYKDETVSTETMGK